MSKRPTSNPYGKAAQNYAKQGTRLEDTRSTEAKALLKAAKMLQDLQLSWDARTQQKIEDTLKYNRQIWVLFYDNALSDDGTRPKNLSTNVVNLASFVFRRSIEILAAPEPEKLDILININREIATGLMAKPSDTPAART